MADPTVASNFVELRRISTSWSMSTRPWPWPRTPAGARGAGAMRRTLRIGITGPIGCGKSAVAGGSVNWVPPSSTPTSLPASRRHPANRPSTRIERFGERYRREDGSLDRARSAGCLLRCGRPRGPRGNRPSRGPVGGSRSPWRPRKRPWRGHRRGGDQARRGGLAQLCDEVWLVTCDPERQYSAGWRVAWRGRGCQRSRPGRSGRRRGRCDPDHRHIGRNRETRRRVREAWTASRAT